MNELLFDNPILIKHLRSRLRQPQISYMLSITLVICCFILWSGFASDGFQTNIPFMMFVGLQALALHLVGTNHVSSSIGQVNDSGVLDFHRISPVKPSAMAIGFVLGAPISEYLIMLVVLPFTLLSAILGKPGFAGFVTVTIALLTTTWLFHLLAALSGLMATPGKSRGTSWAVALFIIVSSFASGSIYAALPLPGMLTAGPALIEAIGGLSMPSGKLPTFFGMELPLFVQTLCYQIPLILFLSIAVMRRMRSAEAPFYSKGTAVAFLIAMSVLNLGGVVGHEHIAEYFVRVLLYVNCTITVFLVGAITPDQGTFLNSLRRANKLGRSHPSQWTDGSSNRVAVIVLCGVTAALVQVAQLFVNRTEVQEHEYLYVIPSTTTLATIAYVGFAAQYFQIRLGPKAKGTLLFLLFCLWIVPLMAGAVASLGLSASFAAFAFAVSPLSGIGTASPISLAISGGLAILFFSLLIREESRAWIQIQDAAKLKVLEMEHAI